MANARLSVTTLGLAVVIAGAGWITGARDAMHGALLAIAAVAFLPFLVLGAGLGVAVVVGALMPHGDAHGLELLIEGPLRLFGPYYRLLFRLRRHPIAVGVPGGALLGALFLWGMIAAFIVPGEVATAAIL